MAAARSSSRGRFRPRCSRWHLWQSLPPYGRGWCVQNLFDRIGVDINQKLPLEAAVDWAVAHEVPYIDLCLDQTPELLKKDSPRLKKARTRLEKAGVRLGLHTLSAVNIAETSPF